MSSYSYSFNSLTFLIYPDVPTPIACAILVCLFTLQHHGTKRIGCLFAPIVITWLIFISGFGLYNIIHCDIDILRAISPVYMLRFIKKTNLRHWKLLSSIVLCIAGRITLLKVVHSIFFNLVHSIFFNLFMVLAYR